MPATLASIQTSYIELEKQAPLTGAFSGYKDIIENLFRLLKHPAEDRASSSIQAPTSPVTLTKGQQRALSLALEGHNLFITGGGGVGKSFVTNKIIDELRKQDKSVLVCASTGKAAQIIGGVTCHRAFRIPIGMTWAKEPQVGKGDIVANSDVILIDEISMLRLDAFEYICRSIEQADMLRAEEGNPPIQLIVVGDFAQLPPVIREEERTLMELEYSFDIGGGYAFKAPSWTKCNFTVCELTEVLRQSDADTVEALRALRFGDSSRLSFFRQHAAHTIPRHPVYLCGKNRTADYINRCEMNKLPGRAVLFRSKSVGEVKSCDKQAPDSIWLKIGARVIMLTNSENWHNGSTGVIKEIDKDSFSITVTLDENNTDVSVSYVTWSINSYEIEKIGNSGKKKIKQVEIGQFTALPLRLGYAITIHRSQGQTYDEAVLVAGKDCQEIFSYGQLYVALSRCKSIASLYINGNIEKTKYLTSPEVTNFYNIAG